MEEFFGRGFHVKIIPHLVPHTKWFIRKKKKRKCGDHTSSEVHSCVEQVLFSCTLRNSTTVLEAFTIIFRKIYRENFYADEVRNNFY